MDEEQKKTESEGESELDKVKAERDEYLAGWQRAKADFINYKKDELSRMERVAKYGEEELMRELIVVLDSFDLAIAAFDTKEGEVYPIRGGDSLRALAASNGMQKGIYMIRAQMEDVLKRYGLMKIPVKAGDAFDPAMHEAIVEVDPPEDGQAHPPGTIVEEIEPGYMLHEKLIRPARVKITKNKE